MCFYQNATTRVKIGGQLTTEIPIKNGVLQGDTLSPLLFTLFLSDFEDYFRGSGAMGVELNDNTSLNAVFFADDLVILATSRARF